MFVQNSSVGNSTKRFRAEATTRQVISPGKLVLRLVCVLYGHALSGIGAFRGAVVLLCTSLPNSTLPVLVGSKKIQQLTCFCCNIPLVHSTSSTTVNLQGCSTLSCRLCCLSYLAVSYEPTVLTHIVTDVSEWCSLPSLVQPPFLFNIQTVSIVPSW